MSRAYINDDSSSSGTSCICTSAIGVVAQYQSETECRLWPAETSMVDAAVRVHCAIVLC
jgi:hypothetical protein